VWKTRTSAASIPSESIRRNWPLGSRAARARARTPPDRSGPCARIAIIASSVAASWAAVGGKRLPSLGWEEAEGRGARIGGRLEVDPLLSALFHRANLTCGRCSDSWPIQTSRPNRRIPIGRKWRVGAAALVLWQFGSLTVSRCRVQVTSSSGLRTRPTANCSPPRSPSLNSAGGSSCSPVQASSSPSSASSSRRPRRLSSSVSSEASKALRLNPAGDDRLALAVEDRRPAWGTDEPA
jgi:hypothetical protein